MDLLSISSEKKFSLFSLPEIIKELKFNFFGHQVVLLKRRDILSPTKALPQLLARVCLILGMAVLLFKLILGRPLLPLAIFSASIFSGVFSDMDDKDWYRRKSLFILGLNCSNL